MIIHQTKGERYGEAGCLLFFLIPFLCFPIMRDAFRDAGGEFRRATGLSRLEALGAVAVAVAVVAAGALALVTVSAM